MPDRIIHVDFAAWGASEARQRALCGPRGYILRTETETPDAPPRVRCAQCGGPVEPTRECYAVPTCHACLPPPAALPVVASPPHLPGLDAWLARR